MAVARKDFKDMYLYAGLGIFLLGTLVGLGYLGFTWYKSAKEQAAYKDLSESIEGYEKVKATGGASSKEAASALADVLQAFQIGAERHRSSSLYPYFVFYQADILGKQGKEQEAVQLMDTATAHMDKRSILYFLYALKDALMNIDSSDTPRVQKGRELLETLANDSKNPLQDMARYYSALDARSQGEGEAAQKRFQQIIAGKDENSIWYKKALNSMR